MDFEGKAKPENVAKINYYKTLNQRAMQKRKAIKHGDLAADKMKHTVGPGANGGIKMISHLNIMSELTVLNKFDF